MPKFKVTITLTQNVEHNYDDYDLDENEADPSELLEAIEEEYSSCDLNEFAESAQTSCDVEEVL